MALQQIKVRPSDLKIGMYVDRLDRPWVETPFMFQGFYIRKHREIKVLRDYCDHVFVDVERGRIPTEHMERVLRTEPKSRKGFLQRVFGRAPAAAGSSITPLRKEVNRASRVYGRLVRSFETLTEEARAGLAPDLSELRRHVRSISESVARNPDAMVWLFRIKQHSGYYYAHAMRSCVWAMVFARHLRLSSQAIEDLALAVLLADVGKTRLPKELLAKSRWTENELQAYQRHVGYAMEMLSQTDGVSNAVVGIVATRNERYDGSGYPKGLSGKEVPYLGQIAGLVHSYDTLIEPLRGNGCTPADGITQLYEMRDRQFEGELVEEFIQAIGPYPAGTLVELSNQEIGLVLEQNAERRLRPKVLVILDAQHKPLGKYRELDLLKETAGTGGKPVNVRRSLEAGAFDIDATAIHETAFRRSFF